MDFRPYYTIQDLDFKDIFPRGKAKAGSHLAPPKSGLVLGVTNPYFESACAHWPHTISLAPLPRTERGLNRSASLSSSKLASRCVPRRDDIYTLTSVLQLGRW